jgi:hypothetical protein
MCNLSSPRLGNATASALNVGRTGEHHAHDAATLRIIILQHQYWAFEGLQNNLLGLYAQRAFLRKMCWLWLTLKPLAANDFTVNAKIRLFGEQGA